MTIIDRDDFTKIIQFSYGPYTFEILTNDDADAEELVNKRKEEIDLEVDEFGDYTHSNLYVDYTDYDLWRKKYDIENGNN